MIDDKTIERAISMHLSGTPTQWRREPKSDLADGTLAFRDTVRCSYGCQHTNHSQRGMPYGARHYIWFRDPQLSSIINQYQGGRP